MPEPNDLLIDLSKIKEYGVLGVMCMILLRYGGQVLTFALDAIGVKIKRKQSLEDELRGEISEVKADFARLWAYSEQFSETVIEMAAAMDREMRDSNISNRVLQVFVRRLKNMRRLSEVFPEKAMPARPLVDESPPGPIARDNV